jgi:hypothetical protein
MIVVNEFVAISNYLLYEENCILIIETIKQLNVD